MDYPLEALGADRFQRMCQALLVRERPRMQCYPLGQADGKRDAVQLDADGKPAVVFQVKFKSVPYGAEARSTIVQAARGEIAGARVLRDRGMKEYVLMTNVPGSARLDAGSMDKVHADLGALLTEALGVSVMCWWRDDIERRLDNAKDVREVYFPDRDGERRKNALTQLIRAQYRDDEYIRFNRVELEVELFQAFIDIPFAYVDLPASMAGEGADAFLSSLRASNVETEPRNRTDGTIRARPTGSKPASLATAAFFLENLVPESRAPLHACVIVGGPGQGKSTLVQYLGQTHRVAWLRENAEAPTALPVPLAGEPRITITVKLPQFADWISGREGGTATQLPPKSLTRSLPDYLAGLIQQLSYISFDVNDLYETAKNYPLLIVLDGLDEIADTGLRQQTVNTINQGFSRLRDVQKNLLLLVTSRPTTAGDSYGFGKDDFAFLRLGALSKVQVASYARRWMAAQELSEVQQREMKAFLSDGLEKPHLRDLAKNPMQLAILLRLVLVKGRALPDKRTQLYDAFVEYFFDREAKQSERVAFHRDLIVRIHKYIGWRLQIAAEGGPGDARIGREGRIHRDVLHSVIDEYLHSEEQERFAPEVHELFAVRWFMFTVHGADSFEFSVQSLQEYFAARFLYDTAPPSPSHADGTRPARFAAIVRGPYWFNVARFYAGCHVEGELLNLADQLEQLMSDNAVGASGRPVALVMALLGDRVFDASSRASRMVLEALERDDQFVKMLPREASATESGVRLNWEGSLVRRVVEKAQALLGQRGRIGFDWMTRIAVLLGSNQAPELNRTWWLAALSEGRLDDDVWDADPGLDRQFSLVIGYLSGALQIADPAEVARCLPLEQLNARTLIILFERGLGHLVARHDQTAAEAIAYLLDWPVAFTDYGKQIGRPLHLARAFFARWSFYGYRFPDEYDLRARIAEFRRTSSELELALTTASPQERQAFDFSTRLASLAQRFESPAEELGLAQAAIEVAYELWGERSAVVSAAMGFTERTGSEFAGDAACSLFEPGVSLVARLGLAWRERRGTEWWRAQFAALASDDDRRLFHRAFWSWGPWAELQEADVDAFARSLDDLSSKEFRELLVYAWVTGLDPVGAPAQGIGKRRVEFRSARHAALLALLDTPRYGRQAFLRFFADDDGGVASMRLLELRQVVALRAAARGDITWDHALAIVRETYRTGADMTMPFDVSPFELPPGVFRTVMADPWAYPAELWYAARDAAVERADTESRSVASWARDGCWFEMPDIYGV